MSVVMDVTHAERGMGEEWRENSTERNMRASVKALVFLLCTAAEHTASKGNRVREEQAAH